MTKYKIRMTNWQNAQNVKIKILLGIVKEYFLHLSPEKEEFFYTIAFWQSGGVIL
ncbi:hypothetical protein [Capnocytophaga sputigena]